MQSKNFEKIKSSKQRFAMKSRCKRLKSELKSNTHTGFKRWGKI